MDQPGLGQNPWKQLPGPRGGSQDVGVRGGRRPRRCRVRAAEPSAAERMVLLRGR